MNPPPRSSSGERPLGPQEQRAIVDLSGINGGPIRLPEELQQEFIGEFNKIYQSHDLKIRELEK